MIPMSKSTAIKKIQSQISLIDSFYYNKPFSEQFDDWKGKTDKILSDIFGNSSIQKNDFIKLKYRQTGIRFLSTVVNDQSDIKYFQDGLDKVKILLKKFTKEIEESWKDDNIVSKDNSRTSLNDFIELKPNFMGLGIDINAIIKNFFKRK